MKNKLSVAFLWHMHQPLYKDLVTGKYHLPWVRLHATYSYLDMISMMYRFPEMKATFNLTPSLMWQLIDMSKEGKIDDIFLELSEKQAKDLTGGDKSFILRNFFSCHPESAIYPVKRYKELFLRRGNDLQEGRIQGKIELFSESDFRDLQVFFNLAWCGFTMKEKDPLVKHLLRKGHKYTEEEKLDLLKRQRDVIALILPSYKKLQDEGRIEISTSPFYHPILPLLCRGRSDQGFDFCDDAKVHIKKAKELYREAFGTDPVGMWPSEGSVSQEIIPLLKDEGVEWMATDEGILLESFKDKGSSRDELIYKAYKASYDGKEIDVLFRDINLSNAISFRYSGMTGKHAALDLIKDIQGIKKAAETTGEDRIVSIILDGENPWPYYHDGGESFLSNVYRYLSSAKDVRPVTIGGFLRGHKERANIDDLYSGSWINRNFGKWIGSPQKNLAWEYLKQARQILLESQDRKKEAIEELYIAEGSDWFWWYDEFGTELNFVFDELFRMHLKNVYELSGKDVPDHLKRPLSRVHEEKELSEAMPAHVMAVYPKVLMVSSEIFPFAKTGGLADVSGSLAKELVSMGCEVRSVMPFYKCVKKGKFELVKEKAGIKDPLTGGMFGFNIYANRSGGVTTYFVDNKRYFFRNGLYGTGRSDYPDNASRFGFFSKAALAAIKAVDFKPDIIHCNDWQTALIPFYLKFKLNGDPFYKDVKTLFTIHNMAYQGVFGKKVMHKLGIPESFFNMDALEFYGKVNLMKAGILYSDVVSTVSRRYAREILTPEFGCGLEGLLETRKERIYGIINGADYSVWSPEKDRYISVNYDASNLEKKKECKKDLIDHAGLTVSVDAPLLGCVTRLVEQKGMDLVADITEGIVRSGVGFVLLGQGDGRYQKLFRKLAKKYPGNVSFCMEFNDELAHKIEAGCDIFLMPSRYEPCGLNQMYSLKYGTIPVVRATGGLDDAIIDFDEDREKGNGFKFHHADAGALHEAVNRAISCYKNTELWKKLMVQAMSYDFSWAHSAKEYVKLYRRLMV